MVFIFINQFNKKKDVENKRKAVITSSKLGQVWHALIVRHAGFEVAEKSDIRIDDRKMEVVDITCSDGTVFVCYADSAHFYKNEISWMTFEQVEKCITESISEHKEFLKNKINVGDVSLRDYQNLLNNAKKIRDMIEQSLIQEQLQEEIIKLKI